MKRNVNLDILKAICAYLVIVIHYAFTFKPAYAEALARVAVPVFFMISGYYCRGESAEIKRKVKHILGVFVASELVYFVYWSWMYRSEWKAWFASVFNMPHMIRFVTCNDTYLFIPGWYLMSLVYMYVLYWGLRKWNLVKLAYGLIPILFLWQWISPRVIEWMNISVNMSNVKVLRAFVFFMLGNLLREKQEIVGKYFGKTHAIIMIAGGAGLVIIERYLLDKIMYSTQFYLYLGTIILALGLFLSAIYLPPVENMPLLAYVGKNLSMYIYVIHMAWATIVGKALGRVDITWIWISVTIAAFAVHYVKCKIRICLEGITGEKNETFINRTML